VGKDIWIDPGRLPALPVGEYYWFEILGLAVFRADTGGLVGRVKAIMPTPAHDVYVVQEGDAEYLIPAVAAVILDIDPDQGRVVIAPEGLAAQSGAY
jgi:16S rRNA processing protein RimM